MKNRKTVFKAFINREKEEAYLNKMNKQGWKLVSVRFAFYTFEKTEPDQYTTVLHFADRLYQTTFIRTVTECGGEIPYQSNAGNCILFYISLPSDTKNVEFLTDNRSKLDSKKRLNDTRKQELALMTFCFLLGCAPGLKTIPSIVKILRFAPEEFFRIVEGEKFSFILGVVCLAGGIICGIIAAYILILYCRTKREIRELSAEMQIFE